MQAKRVRVYVQEQVRASGSHQPLWEAVFRLLRDHNVTGATVFRGMAGFGHHHRVHMARLADVVPDLPLLIEWIDTPERVDALLPEVRRLAANSTITIEDVDVVQYASNSGSH